MNEPKPIYEIDNLAEEYGHEVLRRPPYHYYRDHAGKEGSSAKQSLSVWKEALQKITPEVWSKTIEHTEKEIQYWWERELHFDLENVPPLIINMDENDSDSETFLDELSE
ncbi:hypothetical protein HHI36_000942 [Cryptolaemus montrouzieri]|uniref:Uncharacterized protein n=1 Tax=Cryptolaemus montrouzieri TaxID=559131 RepID=A0ABD2P6G7_9CUCU